MVTRQQINRVRNNHVRLAEDVGTVFRELRLETLRPHVSFAESPIVLSVVPRQGTVYCDMHYEEFDRRLPDISLAVAQIATDHGLHPSNLQDYHWDLRIRG